MMTVLRAVALALISCEIMINFKVKFGKLIVPTPNKGDVLLVQQKTQCTITGSAEWEKPTPIYPNPSKTSWVPQQM
jgi:hypothetical protein